jgi:hypothetical protein
MLSGRCSSDQYLLDRRHSPCRSSTGAKVRRQRKKTKVFRQPAADVALAFFTGSRLASPSRIPAARARVRASQGPKPTEQHVRLSGPFITVRFTIPIYHARRVLRFMSRNNSLSGLNDWVWGPAITTEERAQSLRINSGSGGYRTVAASQMQACHCSSGFQIQLRCMCCSGHHGKRVQCQLVSRQVASVNLCMNYSFRSIILAVIVVRI